MRPYPPLAGLAPRRRDAAKRSPGRAATDGRMPHERGNDRRQGLRRRRARRGWPAQWRAEGRAGVEPGLAVVLVGEDPASEVYVRNKGRQTRRGGHASFEHRLAAETAQEELLALIDRLNARPGVHGILVQLPLPAQLERAGGDRRDRPRRRTSTASTSSTSAGSPPGSTALVPCTPLGCLMLLRDRLGRLAGTRRGGDRPLEHRRQADGAAAARARTARSPSRIRRTPRPGRRSARRADIVVAAVGRPGMVTGRLDQARAPR